MSDLIEEVNQDLKREQASQIWRRYGVYFVGLACALVLAVAGWQFWQKHVENERALASNDYYVALRALGGEEADVAISNLATLGEGEGGYAMLSRFSLARSLAARGETEQALAVWSDLANDTTLEQLYRDLAVVQGAQAALAAGQTDGLEAVLIPLTSEGRPFRNSARQTLAYLAIDQGDLESARSRLQEISDDSHAPLQMRGAASQLLAALGETQ